MNRSRIISVAALLAPLTLSGQQAAGVPPIPDPTMNSFRVISAHFGDALQQAFDSIPASKFGFRPTPPQQTIGYIAQHLEYANYVLCNRLGAAKHPTEARDALPDTLKAAWPKDTLVRRLKASFDFCNAALARLTDADLVVRVPYGAPGSGASALTSRSLLLFVTDLAEHYSQLSSYMRLLGMVPPTALPPRPRTAIELPVAALDKFVGRYDLPPSALQDSPSFVVDVSLKDGALYFKPNSRPAVRIWPESAADFFVKELDVQVTFTRDASGAVTALVLHQGGEDRVANRMK